jgi:hypothetical protein
MLIRHHLLQCRLLNVLRSSSGDGGSPTLTSAKDDSGQLVRGQLVQDSLSLPKPQLPQLPAVQQLSQVRNHQQGLKEQLSD